MDNYLDYKEWSTDDLLLATSENQGREKTLMTQQLHVRLKDMSDEQREEYYRITTAVLSSD